MRLLLHIFTRCASGIHSNDVMISAMESQITGVSTVCSAADQKEQRSSASLAIVTTLRPRQNGRYFADDIFKYIFPNEYIWILINISPKSVPKGRINNISSALVPIMARRRLGDKPLSEPIMVSLLRHLYISLPQKFNSANAYKMCYQIFKQTPDAHNYFEATVPPFKI